MFPLGVLKVAEAVLAALVPHSHVEEFLRFDPAELGILPLEEPSQILKVLALQVPHPSPRFLIELPGVLVSRRRFFYPESMLEILKEGACVANPRVLF